MVAPLRAAAASYAEGTRAERGAAPRPCRRDCRRRAVRLGALSRCLGEGGFDLLCHHAARVGDYRSPDFDIAGALAENTANLRAVLDVLGKGGLKGVVLTGSVFEQDEGAGEEPLIAFSAYGLSKGLTAAVVRHRCREAGVPFKKFVIPNPFGPLEEPRFCAYLVRTWKKGETARVNTPSYLRDNIPVSLLARAYAKFAAADPVAGGGRAKLNPSGYVETQGAFAERFAAAMRPRLKLACGLELGVQTDFSEPLMRVNTNSAEHYVGDWDETAAWDEVGDGYRQ